MKYQWIYTVRFAELIMLNNMWAVRRLISYVLYYAMCVIFISILIKQYFEKIVV